MEWTQLSSIRILDRPWVGVREDRVRFSNGQEQDITVVENKIGVHVLGLFNGNIVLVDKVNYPGGLTNSLELPGGVALPQKPLLAEAVREFSEETGFSPSWCRYLYTLHKGAFRLENPSHVYLASDLIEVTEIDKTVVKDENELINDIYFLPIQEAVDEIGRRIVDTLTCTVVLWLQNQLHNKWWAEII